jgi:3-dehydroquinate dehydratase
MTDFDLRQEKLDEMRLDMLEEQHEERMMTEDLDYALGRYPSINTLQTALEGLERHLDRLGYDFTRKQVLELLEDL